MSPNRKPILTTLAYSAGTQSQCLLEMVLRGDIEKPNPFLVLNADPGMENENSYRFVEQSRIKCAQAGITMLTARTTLAYDLTTFKERSLTRLDLPPYWTKNRITGKIGRLKQRCTRKTPSKNMNKHTPKELVLITLGQHSDTFQLENVCATIGKALAQAKGQ